MRFLVTNDDGIHAPGLRALAEELRKVGEVTVVAPDRERSAVGHSVTFHSPLRVRPVAQEEGYTAFMTDGTPTDCVLLALFDLMKEPPDIVFSGINRGGNLGDDVTYSGTVAGAMEGAIQGFPAVAVSLVGRAQDLDYGAAARFAARLARAAAGCRFPPKTVLNVNVPPIPEDQIEGYEITHQGHTVYDQKIVRRVDPWGTEYFWVTGALPTGEPLEGTDFGAVHRNRISITPIQTNLTNFELLEEFGQWQI
ncbi:MAG: 5'/3'-nucleotidase SurE [Armatimonadetes bacterium]|nr:5'/3'-nucleotidase SurE [Armatimonadota bacterium]